MKKLIFLFGIISGWTQAQMPNISKVWTNNHLPYIGGMSNQHVLKVQVETSEQNKKNDQEYFISGTTIKDNMETKFEGNMVVKKYKDFKKRGKLFGEYEIAEENTGKNTGLYKGKFIFTFDWDPKTKQISNQKIEYKGHWKPYQTEKELKTFWSN